VAVLLASEAAAQEQDQRERACGGQEQPPPLEEELRHLPSVPEQPSRVGGANVTKALSRRAG
jgi:hypothetical protein